MPKRLLKIITDCFPGSKIVHADDQGPHFIILTPEGEEHLCYSAKDGNPVAENYHLPQTRRITFQLCPSCGKWYKRKVAARGAELPIYYGHKC